MDLGPILRAIRRNKARFGLIAVEVALTLAVVVNCVALIADARAQMTRPSGFPDEDLLSVDSTPFGASFKDAATRRASQRADLEVIAAVPGVQAVTGTRLVPWSGGGSSGEFRAVGGGDAAPMLRSQLYNADEKTLEVLGGRLVAGRTFTREEVDRDTALLQALFAGPRARGSNGKPIERYTQDVVVTRAWAEHVFGRGPHLGRMVEDSDGDQYRVIGVFEPFYNPYGWPIHEYAMFYALRASSYEDGTPFLVRAEPGRAAGLAKPIEDALVRAEGQRVIQTQRITEIRHTFFGRQRLVAGLMGMVAVLLVVVTSLGIVGVTSFLVSERVRQIGTRRALGATMIDIVRYFLLENWLVMTIGIVLGVGLAFLLNRALVSSIAGARLDLMTVVVGALALWLLGLASALVPALRAARTSPAVATRSA